MFSGIVEEQGTVKRIEKKENLITLHIEAKKIVRGLKIGDSISVDGVCLTATRIKNPVVSFDVMQETIRATTLKFLKANKKVNLERSLKANSRIDGHFVTGHVDCVGKIKKRVKKPNYVEYQISYPKKVARFFAPKGSVSVDGVSLTVGDVKSSYFSIYLIPHTLAVTTFGSKKANDKVNIETDILAKYLERQK